MSVNLNPGSLDANMTSKTLINCVKFIIHKKIEIVILHKLLVFNL
jgi:hypothetical protein